MIRTSTALFCFLFLILATIVQADTGRIDLPPGDILLGIDGTVIVQGQKGTKGLEFQVDGTDRKGRPSTGLYLEAKPSGNGLLLLIKKKPDSAGFVGEPTVTIKMNPDHGVLFKKLTTKYFIAGISGRIEGHIKGGELELSQCSGPVKLIAKNGTVNVFDHRAPAQHSFDLEIKQGNVSFELGSQPNPGPGRIRLDHGRIKWTLIQPASVAFHGEVDQGLATCNLPLNQVESNTIHFVGDNGRAAWEIRIGKGVLDVTLPLPKK